jgi:hypothetical protein
MRSAGGNRWIPASGIGYVVLFIVGIILTSDSPQASDSDTEILSYYGDSGNRSQEVVVFFLLVIAALLLVWFVTDLRGRLRAVESEPHGLSTLAFAAGIASATLLMAAVAVGVSPSFTRVDSDQFTVDPDTVRLTGDTSYLLLVCSVMVTSILIAATSALAIRTAVLPTWLGWIGLVVALAQLVAIVFVPLFALWGWILVVSIVLMLQPETPRPVREAPPSPLPG